MKYLTILLSTFLIILSCSGHKESCDAKELHLTNNAELKDLILPQFSFSTGACFGYCPIFTIETDSLGIAKLYGERFTYPAGIFESKLSIKQKNELSTLLKSINWDTIPSHYKSMVADAQSYRFIYEDSISTSGNFMMPKSLLDIRSFYLELEKSANWLETEDENYTKEMKNDGAFVSFHEDLNPNDFAKNYPFLERAYFTKVDEKNNVYLLQLNESNLDYDALKKQLLSLEMTNDIQPIYTLKKKEANDKGKPRRLKFLGFELQEGDLLYVDLDCGPLCESIEGVTEGYLGANLSHVGLLVLDEPNQQWSIIEATGKHVRQIPIHDFFSSAPKDDNNNPKVIIGRMRKVYQSLIPKAILYVNDQLGKPYDDVFKLGEDNFYCSELIYFAFGEQVFKLNTMTFKSSKTNEYLPHWVEYFNVLDQNIPEGEKGINPGAMSLQDCQEIVHIYGLPNGLHLLNAPRD